MLDKDAMSKLQDLVASSGRGSVSTSFLVDSAVQEISKMDLPQQVTEIIQTVMVSDEDANKGKIDVGELKGNVDGIELSGSAGISTVTTKTVQLGGDEELDKDTMSKLQDMLASSGGGTVTTSFLVDGGGDSTVDKISTMELPPQVTKVIKTVIASEEADNISQIEAEKLNEDDSNEIKTITTTTTTKTVPGNNSVLDQETTSKLEDLLAGNSGTSSSTLFGASNGETSALEKDSKIDLPQQVTEVIKTIMVSEEIVDQAEAAGKPKEEELKKTVAAVRIGSLINKKIAKEAATAQELGEPTSSSSSSSDNKDESKSCLLYTSPSPRD